jgi:hypothetical protein
MKMLAHWISAGESSSVVGLPGCGRSNLLGFLCHRPDALQPYLLPKAGEPLLVPVDLNSLPANNLATLYRVIIRAFYRVRPGLDQRLQQQIADLYQKAEPTQDPFVAQSALQDILLLFQSQSCRVVLVLNRFDQFCRLATPRMVNTLRSLRDDFKDTLCYIAGMTQEVAYLPNPAALGHMYELLDNYTCWVGLMSEDDARNLIGRATSAAPIPPTEADIRTLLTLTGRYPVLLRMACHWWLAMHDKPAHTGWEAALLAERSFQYRLAKIWSGLTQEEQFIVAELQKLQTVAAAGNGRTKSKGAGQPAQDFFGQYRDVLESLALKGVCCQAENGVWQIAGSLLAAFVAGARGRGRGKIWLDPQTGEIYQGQTSLKELTALEQSVLSFLLNQPRIRHTKTDLIIKTWPDELRREGVSDNSLYQVIFSLRQAIEPDPGQPAYLVTWRGKPEGGYQFFPEGRPK